jgi:hypothetical protein
MMRSILAAFEEVTEVFPVVSARLWGAPARGGTAGRTWICTVGVALSLSLAVVFGSVGTPTARAQVSSFLTPSGNIGCIAFSGYLRCDIAHKSWRKTWRTPCQMGIRGDSLQMRGTGRPIWLCHGDTALSPLGTRPVLPYGRTWHLGPFTCTSRITGLTCSNRSGHGFFLSRQSYRVF